VSGTILPLVLENVSYQAGKWRLIKDVNCTLAAGHRSIVIGPNGAGKSLFLRLCHGLIKPTEGTVSWRGPDAANARRRQAMVFQRPVLLRRSVKSNITYALGLNGVGRRERKRRTEEVLELTGLDRLAKRPARLLSFGEQQKLAVARAWALRPQVMFLDEPTASLDPAATHAIEEIIDAVHDAGTRIVMTTHDLAQAKRLADEVLFIHRGRLLEKSPAAPFFAGPRNDLAEAFLQGKLLWWRLGRDNRYIEGQFKKAAQ
jgi:tungstate transport system ATP-binding protein